VQRRKNSIRKRKKTQEMWVHMSWGCKEERRVQKKKKKPWKYAYACPGGVNNQEKYKKKKRNPRNMHTHIAGVQRKQGKKDR
jgi:hypothetical protein